MFRVIAAATVVLTAIAVARADEVTPSTHDGIVAWQQRLTDAGCYKAPINGVAGPAFDAAVNACPDMKPFLRVETGMHTASIKHVGVDASCHLMATSSDDKTVRIWSLPDGRLLRTVRLPISEGNKGKVYAAALSPDGAFLAAGGYDANKDASQPMHIYVVELATSRVRQFGNLPEIVDSIAFSRDGAYVATGLGGKNGVRVYQVASGVEVLTDHEYSGDVYGLDFAPDGTLFTSSKDGYVRRYSPEFRLQLKRRAPGGKWPTGIAIDPQGQRLAVAYDDTAGVSILDARSLAALARAETSDVDPGLPNRNLGSVAWSEDGRLLVAGGVAERDFGEGERAFVRRFSRDGKRQGNDISIAPDTIMDLRTCGDGFAVADAEPSFGMLSVNGEFKRLQVGSKVDMINKLGNAFAISDSAETVRFGLERGENSSVVFDLKAAALVDSHDPLTPLHPALVKGLPVKYWHDHLDPQYGRLSILLDQGEGSRSLVIKKDLSGFVMGTDHMIRAFSSAPKQIWAATGTDVAWGVNLSADEKIIAVAEGDGTVRWLRASDGVELLALFVEPRNRRWVAWTPGGYYMASAGGEDLIGWHLNRGWTQLADFFPVSHFQGFNRPDIVQLVLSTRDEAEAVRQANEKIKDKPAPAPETVLPPVVTISAAGDDGHFAGETVEVSFDVRSPSGAPISRVDALIDGVRVDARGLAPSTQQLGDKRHLTIPSPPRDFELALIAYDGSQASEPATVRLTWTGGGQTNIADRLKPTLYVATIGVSDYVRDDLRLTWANEDARGFTEAIKSQAGGLYSDVKVLAPLVDRAVTRSSVIAALRWLRKQATSRDVGMVLIAGHGVTDDAGNYYFLPSDATPEDLDGSGVSQDDILREMRQIAGKAILFLDTCHANQAVASGVARRGATNIDSVVNEFSRAENGLVVFSASRGRETSRESAEWRHGAFTKALIEGLAEGKADLLHQGTITLSELDAFLTDRVKAMTDGEQHPVMTRPPTMPDFPFATAR